METHRSSAQPDGGEGGGAATAPEVPAARYMPESSKRSAVMPSPAAPTAAAAIIAPRDLRLRGSKHSSAPSSHPAGGHRCSHALRPEWRFHALLLQWNCGELVVSGELESPGATEQQYRPLAPNRQSHREQNKADNRGAMYIPCVAHWWNPITVILCDGADTEKCSGTQRQRAPSKKKKKCGEQKQPEQGGTHPRRACRAPG